MKLYNISGTCKSSNDYNIDFAGLFLLNNEEIKEIFMLTDEYPEDKYIFRDLSFLKTIGKDIFDTIKNYNIDDVIFIENVKINEESYTNDFLKDIKNIILNQNKNKNIKINKNDYFKHYKNQKIYQVVDFGEIQENNKWVKSIIYKEKNGNKLYIRSEKEFKEKFNFIKDENK